MPRTPIAFVIFLSQAMAGVVAVSPFAYAERSDEVDPRVNEAMSACLANNLDKGIEILAQLYAETRDAVWVFNQARCYQQNDRLEEARKRFLEFRRTNRRKDRARDARAKEYVAEIDKELERRQKSGGPATAPTPIVDAPKAEPVPPVPAIPEYVPPAAPAERAGADLAAGQSEPDGETTPLYSKWWFWAGVGGVLAATAAVIAVPTLGPKIALKCGQEECVSGP